MGQANFRKRERGVPWLLHKWEALKKMIYMIPNEPVKRNLKRPVNAQGQPYASFSKGNRSWKENKTSGMKRTEQ